MKQGYIVHGSIDAADFKAVAGRLVGKINALLEYQGNGNTVYQLVFDTRTNEARWLPNYKSVESLLEG